MSTAAAKTPRLVDTTRPKLADLVAAAKAETRAQVNGILEQIKALSASCEELSAQDEFVPPGIIETTRRMTRVLEGEHLNIQSLAQKHL
ncbi:hypothetical protein CcrC1_gp236c [Caulobacter phage C1]|nr:hypothetical protein CcrC1_gp236c [Caulobacter phage C1]UTU08465.1 hypothetical protein CcrC2_gp237c [Caulobacter phage C2]UTU10098.1 hypothetical protein CcrRB23_gp236c [Caulobacter phage RB23]UXY92604.1 hypothetical protein CcrJ4_gp231c [Caulobacter phage J4]WGN97133.1 hypothetical protein [Bertelyvirus sp.]